jgi:hypothetical protein
MMTRPSRLGTQPASISNRWAFREVLLHRRIGRQSAPRGRLRDRLLLRLLHSLEISGEMGLEPTTSSLGSC